MYSNKIVFAGLFLLCISGCVATLYIPTAEDAQKNNTTVDSLSLGRELYINKCSNCHNLYLPSSYTKEEWKKIIDDMQKRSKIDDKQKESIYTYVQINAK